MDFLFEEYGGDLKKMKTERLAVLRGKLLQVKGIGPETADSILLYGLRKPIFVVDAYTKRILSRHGMISEKASYEEVQGLFMDHLSHNERLFNEYHALLVHLGKNACKKKPRCGICPLKGIEHSAKKDGEIGRSGDGEKKKAESRTETRARTRLRRYKP
jgi:endonuclease-3 related protein